jgi:hypothetical protein
MPTGKYDRSVRIWIDAALKKMGAGNLAGSIHFQWNPRLTRTIGRANFFELATLFPKNPYLPKFLEFSPELFERASVIDRRETVYHEVAHAVDAFNGTYNANKPHGPSWKELMKKAGVPPTRCHFVPVVHRGAK